MTTDSVTSVSHSVNVLFVCLGNICRSPTAEAVFRHYVDSAGLAEQVVVDSVGTAGYHIGAPSDSRAIEAAQRRGYDMSAIRARQVAIEDFEQFDYILAMDKANLQSLLAQCPEQHAHKLALFLSHGDTPQTNEVPDPYYGDGAGFETVLNLVESASQGLLQHIIDNPLQKS